MNKLHQLAVFVTITAFFSLISVNGFSQCENAVRGYFTPLVAQTPTFETQGGELWLVGIKADNNLNFPCSFEWREGDVEGKIITSNTIKNAIQSPPVKSSKGKISNLSKGKYTLIIYDNSTPCKRVEKTFDIK